MAKFTFVLVIGVLYVLLLINPVFSGDSKFFVDKLQLCDITSTTCGSTQMFASSEHPTYTVTMLVL